MPKCYYYDEQHNRCKCYANESLDELLGENAKLRELVRDIADHIKHDDGFGIDRGWMLDRIREIGIEVDDDN